MAYSVEVHLWSLPLGLMVPRNPGKAGHGKAGDIGGKAGERHGKAGHVGGLFLHLRVALCAQVHLWSLPYMGAQSAVIEVRDSRACPLHGMLLLV